MLTSRVAVADIQRFQGQRGARARWCGCRMRPASNSCATTTSGESDKELRAASHEFGGYPLALTLLASLLKETQCRVTCAGAIISRGVLESAQSGA